MWRESRLQTAVSDLSSGNGPLEHRFARNLNELGVSAPLALAVSGGGDSAALLHLTAAWAKARGIDLNHIHVLTVDHDLRANSKNEARAVSAWADAYGMPHETLLWGEAREGSGLQQRARAARRDLLGRWCKDHNIKHLILAHTRDDQTETVGMRLIKDSGSAGLAGMDVNAPGPFGTHIIRPLLDVQRAELRDWLAANRHDWFEDPSNQDLTYERVKIRNALSQDAALRAEIEGIGSAAAEARAALKAASGAFLESAVRLHAAGWAELDLQLMRDAPRTVVELSLSSLLAALGGREYPPARKSLSRFFDRLIGSAPEGGTLSGALVVPEGQNSVLLGREARNIPSLALTARKWAMWDHRFEVRASEPACAKPLGEWEFSALGQGERERIKAAVPPVFRNSLMVLELESGAHLVPHAGIGFAEDLEVVFDRLLPFGHLRPGDPAKGREDGMGYWQSRR